MTEDSDFFVRKDLERLTGTHYNTACKLFLKIYDTLEDPKDIHRKKLPKEVVKRYLGLK